MLSRSLLALATALAALSFCATPAKADGGSSIANAPLLVPGQIETGAAKHGEWSTYYRIELKKDEELTIDLASSDVGNGLCIYTYDPHVDDYNLNSPNFMSESIGRWRWCTSSSNGKTQLDGTAPVGGLWTIAIEGCDLGCWGSTGDWSYQLQIVRPAAPLGKPKPSSSDCADFYVIDSRGSGETPNQLSSPGKVFFSALTVRASNLGKTVGEFTNPYPAINGWKIAGGLFKLQPGYWSSVDAGIQWVKAKVGQLANQCPASKLYLSGYSQGADVAATAYQRGATQDVGGIVLFGDPAFNASDTWADRGNFATSPNRVNGLRGSRDQFYPQGLVLSFCHRHDPICQRDLEPISVIAWRLKTHKTYDSTKEAELAAEYFLP